MTRQARHTLAPAALTALAGAALLALSLPASAQSNDELLRELRALKDRVNQLEQQLQAGKPAAAAPGQWGMTPEQTQELNRVTTKAEALEDSRDAMGFKGLKISGYMDPAFVASRRQNTAGFQFLNGVGDDGYAYDNSTFGSVALDLLKETDSGTKYHLTLVPNRGTESIMNGANRIVQEASVQVPLGDPATLLIAGHVPDWSGYEYTQPTLNKLITHNLLFDLTLPTAYTGVGTQVTSGKWITKAMLANMNTSKRSAGNKMPVIAYRADYAATEYFGFGFAGVHGKAANFSENVTTSDGFQLNPTTGLSEPNSVVVSQPDSRVDLFEIDAYFTRGDWNFNGQFSVGRQAAASVTAAADGSLRAAQWWGLSGLASYKFTQRIEGIVRADYINNKKNGGGLLGYATNDGRNGIGNDGVDTETGANRYALTVGLNYAIDPTVVFKTELRHDAASRAVFEDVRTGTLVKNNQLFATSLVVSF
ncbi:DUF3138 family protein [Leptothrix discophora]|uniref:DUF3138 family protein n=1 Tax=Leptothrix discophora TaxID=89 RepID=A0ABT9G2Q3_LEPDI|nr:DUF3138 family protein [Leptothrix discophora]MDP4300705.1 DUF3138 family protein [Leptothrix discophora]